MYKLLFETFTRYNVHLPVVLKEISKESIDTMIDQSYVKQLQSLNGDMAKWINSFLDMLLNMIHFQRSGNWSGFMEKVYKFLPYCFDQNRQNYSKNLSYFYLLMRKLETENEDAYVYMVKGGFTGSLTGKSHPKILSTGEIATESMKKEFQKSEERGEKARAEFFQRLTTISGIIRSKKSYYDKKTQQPFTIFKPEKKQAKYKLISSDEGQSFIELLAQFDGEVLDLKNIMNGRVTSKPWMIVNENDKTRKNAKSVF